MKGKVDTPDATAPALDRWKAWAVLIFIGGLSTAAGFLVMLVLWFQNPLSPSFERSRVPIGVLLTIGFVLGMYSVARSLQWYMRAK